jgi:hypothetical protein
MTNILLVAHPCFKSPILPPLGPLERSGGPWSAALSALRLYWD